MFTHGFLYEEAKKQRINFLTEFSSMTMRELFMRKPYAKIVPH